MKKQKKKKQRSIRRRRKYFFKESNPIRGYTRVHACASAHAQVLVAREGENGSVGGWWWISTRRLS